MPHIESCNAATATLLSTSPGQAIPESHSDGRIYREGSLSFMGMFWKNGGGGLGPANSRERYGVYDFYKDYCVRF